LITIKKKPRSLLRGRFQLSRAGCFVPGQMLVLEDTHADGVAVFTIDKELMNFLASLMLWARALSTPVWVSAFRLTR
jgi:hypothetical protein